ncbi:MAG TPA: hypothetical protein VN683_08335 [Acidothermaceae bacterium]|nr:hypothetical protein [Acidothermaceae bacterium]
MNDEDLARQAFAAAFRSGQTGEPPTLPDVELLAQHGRRANRHRHGLYAAGSTVLAGVAVAGVVAGPALLGLGSTSPSDVGTGAQGATTPPSSPTPSPSKSAPDTAQPSPGVPCATPPAINWLSVANGALPAGVTATLDHSAKCVQTSNGSRSIEALFTLSTGTVQLQVNAQTGPDIATKLGGGAAGQIAIAREMAPAPQSLDPSTEAKLEASKMAAGLNSASAVEKPAPSPSASLDAAAIASLEAQKRAMASGAATKSPAPGAATDGSKGVDDQSCSPVSSDETACVSHLTKGSLSVVDVQLLRTGGNPIAVDVAASNGKDLSVPAAEQLPSDATMVALAQAVASHF